MYPADLKYNLEHTWLRVEAPNSGRAGITDYAQRQLKEVVFVELPEVETEVIYMEPFGVIESVKATNDLYSPVTGKVMEVNTTLKEDPGLVNRDPYGDGWMVTIEMYKPEEIDGYLLSAEEYGHAIGEE